MSRFPTAGVAAAAVAADSEALAAGKADQGTAAGAMAGRTSVVNLRIICIY